MNYILPAISIEAFGRKESADMVKAIAAFRARLMAFHIAIKKVDSDV
jgi:hypothetical protein